MTRRAFIVPVLSIVAFSSAMLVANAQSQHQHQHGNMAAPAPQDAAAVTRWRVTMDDLHRMGGVPRGWKFMLPQGDAARGRQVFADLECYKCHAIKGESFPATTADARNVGPDLTGMGALHPAEYLAESILQPNRVIVQGPGFTGPDGLSLMPGFSDSLTVSQLVDLVAFLKSQTSGGDHAGHGTTGMEREAVAGDFKVRLSYVTGHEEHMHGASGA